MGERGEACIIVKQSASGPDEQHDPIYRLASGERLKLNPNDGTFETFDGLRKFRLRQA